MKGFLRSTIVDALALFLLPYLVQGVTIIGGLWTIFIGGLILNVLFHTLKPLLTILSIPFNIVTLGFFSVIINAIIFYVFTVVVPQIQIRAFTFPGTEVAGFIIPKIDFNVFFAYIATAFLYSLIVTFVKWLTQN